MSSVACGDTKIVSWNKRALDCTPKEKSVFFTVQTALLEKGLPWRKIMRYFARGLARAYDFDSGCD